MSYLPSRPLSRVASMRLNIDFSGKRQSTTGWAVLLVMLVIAATVMVTWESTQTFLEYQQSTQALAGARLQAKPSIATISPKQIDAINRVIRQLNLPWKELFAAVEGNLSERIALLALEPDASNRILRINAEAKSPEDMMDFVGAVEKEGLFLSATLIRHEINDSDRNRPYRFALEASWRDQQ